MLALKCDFFFQGPTIKIRMFTYSWKCEEVPQRTIERPIALQLNPPPTPSHSAPTPHATPPISLPFDFHLAGLAVAREPCKRAGGRQPRPSGLTLLSKTDITGGMRADESYLLLSDVAVTFRSGQRSKWHSRQIY